MLFRRKKPDLVECNGCSGYGEVPSTVVSTTGTILMCHIECPACGGSGLAERRPKAWEK